MDLHTCVWEPTLRVRWLRFTQEHARAHTTVSRGDEIDDIVERYLINEATYHRRRISWIHEANDNHRSLFELSSLGFSGHSKIPGRCCFALAVYRSVSARE